MELNPTFEESSKREFSNRGARSMLNKYFAMSALFCLSTTLACGEPTAGAPIAVLDADVLRGPAPLTVQFSAKSSIIVGGDANDLSYRWDLDGDGEWDDDTDEADAEETEEYLSEGEIRARVEVSVDDGEKSTADLIITVDRALIDIDADSNRDGLIDDKDEENEDVWGSDQGAVVFANFDDDDGDNRSDASDQIVNGSADESDLVEMIVRQTSSRVDGYSVELSIDPVETGDYIRLFQKDSDGDLEVLYTPGYPAVELDANELRDGDMRLFAEAIQARSSSWDYTFDVVISVKDDGGLVAEDRVSMQVAPVVFPDNLLTPEILYIMDIDNPNFSENTAFFNAVDENLPPRVLLFGVDQYLYGGDRWVQDNMQTGYQLVPGIDGEHKRLLTYMNLERGGGGLESFVTDELFGPDVAYVASSGSPQTGLNYGGNLEIAPPHTTESEGAFPVGRILVGGGRGGTILGTSFEDHMGAPQRNFLESQDVQAPLLELSSEWLIVGHLDEIFLFIPDHREESERNWKVVFASPALARTALESAAENGGGNRAVFDGRETETTVNGILTDDDLMDYNELVQVRIDSIRAKLMDAMDLTDEDIIEVPVLFEYTFYGPLDLSVAYNPGIQNLIAMDNTLFVPDPEGPEDGNGDDPWKTMVRQSLEPLGHTVIFVDVFDSYHLLLGEAHCGSNVQRASHAIDWWTK
jgi:protein-arginine deiminase